MLDLIPTDANVFKLRMPVQQVLSLAVFFSELGTWVADG